MMLPVGCNYCYVIVARIGCMVFIGLYGIPLVMISTATSSRESYKKLVSCFDVLGS